MGMGFGPGWGWGMNPWCPFYDEMNDKEYIECDAYGKRTIVVDDFMMVVVLMGHTNSFYSESTLISKQV